MRSSQAAACIREHRELIAADWERAVLEHQPQLAELSHEELIDHLPDVLEALAQWLDGRQTDAELRFEALAEGHAVQRLLVGCSLEDVNGEYAQLRKVILRCVLGACRGLSSEDIVRLNEALDRAIDLSVRRYTHHRDLVRDKFIGILGHDLRTPLNSARAAVALLKFEPMNATGQARIQTIARAVGRMERMVADVLDFARGHLGSGMPVVMADNNFGEVCRLAVDEVQEAHPTRQITLASHGDLRAVFDRDRVMQALANLLANAVSHGEDPIRLEVMEDVEHAQIVTRVSNRGVPIAEDRIPSLFERPSREARLLRCRAWGSGSTLSS